MEPDWRQGEWNDSAQRRRNLVEVMHHELHDLCQPLTALLCMLEIGRMTGNVEGMREALDGATEETRRLFAMVARMRSALRAEERVTADDLLSRNPVEITRLKEN